MAEPSHPIFTKQQVQNLSGKQLRHRCELYNLRKPTGGKLRSDDEMRAALWSLTPAVLEANQAAAESKRPEKHRRSTSVPRPAKRRSEESEARRRDTRFRVGDEKKSGRAWNNQIVLEGFHLSRFTEARVAGNVPLKKGGQWPHMKQELTELTHSQGEAVVVDEDGFILFLYLPGLAKDATQEGLVDNIHNLMDHQKMNWDDMRAGGDSRAGPSSHIAKPGLGLLAPQTILHGAVSNPDLGQSLRRSSRIRDIEKAKLAASITPAREALTKQHGVNVVFSDITPLPEPPLNSEDEEEMSDVEDVGSSDMPGVRGGSWHFCLAWFQRGQHRRIPPAPSADLRAGQDNPDIMVHKTHIFAWKSPMDKRINNIVRWWFPTFYKAVEDCKTAIIDTVKPRPPPELLEKWESVYPHLALGYNRMTHKHRDCGGVVHGLDCLLLTGDFEGGNLYLPDLNLRVEWGPGDFCAFDGKLFTHEVEPWSGKERMCFIYFVKRNIFEHYGLPSPLSPPSLHDIDTELALYEDNCGAMEKEDLEDTGLD